MRADRRVGTPRCGGGGRGQSRGDRKKNLSSKEKLDACTIVDRDYSKEKYARLTPTEKLKLWMIRNPGKAPGTGLTRQSRGRDRGETALITSTSLTGTKCTADASNEGDTANNDTGWGHERSRNRDNPGISGRQHSKLQYCLPTYGMRIHEACRSGLTYPITRNSFTLLLEPQVDTCSYGTLLAPSTMMRVCVQLHTTQMMIATRFTRRIRYKRMH